MTQEAHPATGNAIQGPVLQQLARIAHALGCPARLAMVGLLAHGERTVNDLAQATHQSLATASAHLKVLRGACLVTTDKRGREVHCRLAGENVSRFWLALRTLGEELLPEVREVLQQFADDPSLLSPLSPGELAAELKAGRVTLIDLRSLKEFQSGHLPGAINLPYSSLASLVRDSVSLPKGSRLYAYCRGPYCVSAREGTKKLRALGLRVDALRFSYPEWHARFRSPRRRTESAAPAQSLHSK